MAYAAPLPARFALASTGRSSPTTVTDTGISVMNLSARQRMLSQRLVMLILLAIRGNTAKLEQAEQTLTQFEQSQAKLVQTAQVQDGRDGETLRAVYFGTTAVARTVDRFIRYAKDALQHGREPSTETEPALQYLIDHTDEVLQALNTATTAFDQLTTAKEATLQRELQGIVCEIETVAREAKVVSFNAQVIAARAGHVGREFAVVAGRLSNISTEVDTLAKRGLALASR